VNDLMMQFQADVLGVRGRPRGDRDNRAGSAYLADWATGFWAKSRRTACETAGHVRFEAADGCERRLSGEGRWQRAVERSKSWSE